MFLQNSELSIPNTNPNISPALLRGIFCVVLHKFGFHSVFIFHSLEYNIAHVINHQINQHTISDLDKTQNERRRPPQKRVEKGIIVKNYKTRSDTILDDEGAPHIVYGIDLPTESIPDIFCSQKEAEDFATLCNSLDLSPLHIHEVIEDLL